MKKYKYIILITIIINLIFTINIKVNASNIISEYNYENLNIRRSYIIGDYIFDLGKYNPTLKDLMLAAQTQDNGNVSIIELKIAEDINGNKTKIYTELLENKKLTKFPVIKPIYIYYGSLDSKSFRNI